MLPHTQSATDLVASFRNKLLIPENEETPCVSVTAQQPMACYDVKVFSLRNSKARQKFVLSHRESPTKDLEYKTIHLMIRRGANPRTAYVNPLLLHGTLDGKCFMLFEDGACDLLEYARRRRELRRFFTQEEVLLLTRRVLELQQGLAGACDEEQRKTGAIYLGCLRPELFTLRAAPEDPAHFTDLRVRHLNGCHAKLNQNRYPNDWSDACCDLEALAGTRGAPDDLKILQNELYSAFRLVQRVVTENTDVRIPFDKSETEKFFGFCRLQYSPDVEKFFRRLHTRKTKRQCSFQLYIDKVNKLLARRSSEGAPPPPFALEAVDFPPPPEEEEFAFPYDVVRGLSECSTLALTAGRERVRGVRSVFSESSPLLAENLRLFRSLRLPLWELRVLEVQCARRLEGAPESELPQPLAEELAHACIRNQRYERALELLQVVESRARNGADPELLSCVVHHAALCLQSLGRSEEAAAKYREVLALSNADSELQVGALVGLGNIVEAQGSKEEAYDLLRKAYESQVRHQRGVCALSVERYAELAQELLAKREFESALEEARSGIQLAEEKLDGQHARLSELHRLAVRALTALQRRPEDLIPHLRRVVELEARAHDALVQLSELLTDAKQHEESLRHAQRLVDSQRATAEIAELRVREDEELHDPDENERRRIYADYVQKHSLLANYLLNVGNLHRHLKNPVAALNSIQESLALTHKLHGTDTLHSVKALNLQALVYFDMEQFELAQQLVDTTRAMKHAEAKARAQAQLTATATAKDGKSKRAEQKQLKKLRGHVDTLFEDDLTASIRYKQNRAAESVELFRDTIERVERGAYHRLREKYSEVEAEYDLSHALHVRRRRRQLTGRIGGEDDEDDDDDDDENTEEAYLRHLNCGSALSEAGKNAEALKSFQQAAAIADKAKIRDERHLSSLHSKLGLAYKQVGDFENALKHLKFSRLMLTKVLEGLAKESDATSLRRVRTNLASVTVTLGQVHVKLGELDKGLELLLDGARALENENGDGQQASNLAPTYYSIGEAYEKCVRLIEATSYYEKSIETLKHLKADENDAPAHLKKQLQDTEGQAYRVALMTLQFSQRVEGAIEEARKLQDLARGLRTGSLSVSEAKRLADGQGQGQGQAAKKEPEKRDPKGEKLEALSLYEQAIRTLVEIPLCCYECKSDTKNSERKRKKLQEQVDGVAREEQRPVAAPAAGQQPNVGRNFVQERVELVLRCYQESAEIFFELEQYSESIAAAFEVHKLDKKNMKAMMLMAKGFRALGQYEEAIKVTLKIDQFFENHPKSRKMREECERMIREREEKKNQGEAQQQQQQ